MTAETFVGLIGENTLALALAAGFFVAFLNLLGASLVLVWRDPSERSLDTMLGFAAGIMLCMLPVFRAVVRVFITEPDAQRPR